MDGSGRVGSALADDGEPLREDALRTGSPRTCVGRNERGVADMERALFTVSLFGEETAVRGPDPVSGQESGPEVRGRSGVLVGLVEGGGPGCLDRMERGRAEEEPREGAQQQPLPDRAPRPGSSSGLASSGPASPATAGRLRAALRRAAGSCRDLCGAGEVCGDLLPGGELHGDRADGGSGAPGPGDVGQDGLGLRARPDVPGGAQRRGGRDGPAVSRLLRLDGGGVRRGGPGRCTPCGPVPDSGL